jgi:uncharacterized protein YbaP (TraB family)
MRSFKLGSGLAAAALLTAALAAPTWAAPDETPWSVTELVVTAKARGPVLWRISRAGSEVWVLGVLPVLPKDQAWSTGRLERAIEGANAVLTPVRANADLFTALGILTHMRLPAGPSLDQRLPPALEARFAAARTLAKKPADRYARIKPVWASFMLLSDYMAAAKLDQMQPQQTVVRLAHRHNVPVRPIATYGAKSVLKNLAELPDAEAQACLADAVTDIERAQAHARAAAQAWAVGDLKTAIAHHTRAAMAQCVEQSASFNTLEARSVADTVAAIDAALAKPGKTVAIFSLEDLLRRDGALERLRAQPGVTVTAPDM